MFSKKMGIIATAEWLRHWIANPGVSDSTPVSGSKVGSTFHPFEVDQMNTKNSWGLSDKK